MIELGLVPVRRIVARLTRCGEAGRRMIWIRRVVVIRLMTEDTRRRRPIILIVDMARGAIYAHMRAG